MIWINYIFGLLILNVISCSPAISHGKNIRIQRSLDTGRIEVKDPKDPKYVELANLSMKKYESDTGSNQSYLVLQVTRATEQVVAGLLTNIDFYVLQSEHGYIVLELSEPYVQVRAGTNTKLKFLVSPTDHESYNKKQTVAYSSYSFNSEVLDKSSTFI